MAALITHPRRTLLAAAAHPEMSRAALAVVLTGLVSLALDIAASIIGAAGSAAVILSIALPLMLVVFWLVSGLLIGAGARLMGREPRRHELLAVTGLTFPVLVLYALIALVQAASPRWGGDALAAAVGLLALPLVGWFVVLNAIAVRAVYDTPALSAVALALIPYAALSAVLLVLVLLVSLLHSVGAV
ncbi:MAG: YIP1 family protein [Candidatus Dormibacter sp.]